DRGLFAGRAVSLPSDTSRSPVIATRLKVWRTTSDPTVIGIVRDDLFVVPSSDNAAVIESIRVFNSSNYAYIGRGGGLTNGTTGSVPSLALSLPAGANANGVSIVRSDVDIPEL